MKKNKEILGLNEEAIKLLMKKDYDIMLDDIDRSFNINMHTFSCYALSYQEAIGKMYLQRPEFRNREILSIKETPLLPNAETVQVYVSEAHKKAIENALKTLKLRRN